MRFYVKVYIKRRYPGAQTINKDTVWAGGGLLMQAVYLEYVSEVVLIHRLKVFRHR